MAGFIFEIALIIGIASVLALFGRMIRQPPIIAYLITGILVGPLFFGILESTEIIETLARLGVAFLLFIVGLSLDFRVLKDIGGIAAIAGIGEIVAVSAVSFAIAIALGFSYTPALYLAVALAFSSTVVVVKLLSDKKELDTLHGKIALGILIVEDFVAALVLMVIPVLGSGAFTIIIFQIVKAVFLIGFVFLFSHIIFPGVLSVAARNQEILLLFSIAWALLISILFDFLGFSLEIGALIAGMALASSKYNLEISSKIKGLRDFFVVLFFVFFGSQLVGPITSKMITQAVIFSVFILIGKPFIIMSFMRFFGYKKRTNFFTGVSLAQISEFSLILILLGFTLGFVNQELFSLVILISLITIALSAYSIFYSQPIFRLFSPILRIFDGNKKDFGSVKKEKEYDVLLFGYNRIGFNLLKMFEKSGRKYLVVDYNPRTVIELSRKGVNCIYGDANDDELLKDLRLDKFKLIISTIPEMEINLRILENVDKKRVIFVPTSHNVNDTKTLYNKGADYVIMPHFLGGEHMANILKKTGINKKAIDSEGEKHRKELFERSLLGHEHPRKDFHGR